MTTQRPKPFLKNKHTVNLLDEDWLIAQQNDWKTSTVFHQGILRMTTPPENTPKYYEERILKMSLKIEELCKQLGQATIPKDTNINLTTDANYTK